MSKKIKVPCVSANITLGELWRCRRNIAEAAYRFVVVTDTDLGPMTGGDVTQWVEEQNEVWEALEKAVFELYPRSGEDD